MRTGGLARYATQFAGPATAGLLAYLRTQKLLSRFGKRKGSKSTTKQRRAIRKIKVRSKRPRRMRRYKSIRMRRTRREQTTVVYRWYNAGQCGHDLGFTSGFTTANTMAIMNKNSIEGTPGLLSALPFFDVTNPGTLLEVNAVEGAYAQKFHIGSMFIKVDITNNCNYVVYFEMIHVRYKVSTDVNCATIWDNGRADVGTEETYHRGWRLTDSPRFNQLCSVVKRRLFRLLPGRRVTFRTVNPGFTYDPSLTDLDTNSFQPKFRAATLMYRSWGDITQEAKVEESGSTTLGPEFAFGEGHVVFSMSRTCQVNYDGGFSGTRYSMADSTAVAPTEGYTFYQTQVKEPYGKKYTPQIIN